MSLGKTMEKKTRNSDRNKCILKRAKYLIFAWITLFDMGTVCQAQWEDFHFTIRVHIDKVKMVTYFTLAIL